MPRYEMSVIFRVMKMPELKNAIKRTAESVLQRGGIIRSLDNIGQRKLPHKTFKHGTRFDEGHYYLIEFDSPPSIIEELKDHLSLDLDIVKPRVLRMEEEITRPCQNRPCDFGEMTLESRKRLKADLQNCIKKL